MIGNDILNSFGAGAGVSSGSIVEQLVDIEKMQPQEGIDSNRELLETKISDFGLLRSALSTLQDAADLLADPATFNAKNATFSESTSVSPLSLGDDAPEGDYTIEVLAIAQAQSLSSSVTFADPTDVVGKGTVTFNFGQWDTVVPPAQPSTFTADADSESFSITIDDSNNSLNGLRDAINAADRGVQATIINDGGTNRLVVTAPSGATQELEMVVVDEDGFNNDASGLSRFSMESGAALQMTQNQVGADSSLVVNGLTVSRSSNLIDDVIGDFEFSLTKASPGEVMTVSIFDDKQSAKDSIIAFVDTYNEFLTAVEPLIGYNEETQENGSLSRESLARTLMSDLTQTLTGDVSGVGGVFASLSAIGIRSEIDGTLSIDNGNYNTSSLNELDSFNEAFENNFDAVKAIFAPQTSSSSDKVTINGFGPQTEPGSYDLVVTSPPTHGSLAGAAASGSLLGDLATAVPGYLTGSASDGSLIANLAAAGANDYDFTVDIDGVTTGTISLTPGTYADESALASHIQTQINADAANDVTVSYSDGAFVVTSNTTGASSGVSAFTSVGGSADELGLHTGTATAGSDSAYPNAYDFIINVDGATSGTISITPGTYASQEDLAAHLQAQINGDSTLKASGADVDVTWDGANFNIVSRGYGSSSQVIFTAIGDNAADLGLSTGSTTAGTNVAGTIDGVAGFGVGNVLLPALKEPAHGLSFILDETATSSTVTFSRGVGGTLSQLMENYLQSNGFFDKKVGSSQTSVEFSLHNELTGLDDVQEKLDRRIEAYQSRLSAQFLLMDQIVAGLNSSGSFLDGILDRLPFTAQN